MSIGAQNRQIVRERADFACEYCGVSEADSGGELTVDHYQPQSAMGGDDLENLVYACFRCNLYKGDYWNESEPQRRIFNPRLESRTEHFLLSPNGALYALTKTAEFTIEHLKLNRAPLVTYRRKLIEQTAKTEIIEQMRETINLLTQANRQQRKMLDEQSRIIGKQEELLKILLRSKDE